MAAPTVLSLGASRTVATPRARMVSGRLSRLASVDFALIIFLSAVGFLLALAHPWSHAYIGAAQYGDAAYWDFAGESWARGYLNAKAPDIRPGYSVFLGIIYSLSGANWRAAFAVQALLYAVGVAMAFTIGKRLGGRLVGLLAATLLVLDPYMWEWTATSTTELIGSVSNLAALFFTIRALRGTGRLGSAAAAGVCLAIANVVRPLTLPYLAVIVLAVALRQVQWKWRVLTVVSVIGAATLMTSPSILYEYVTTGEANLSSDTAANLYAASSPKYGTWTPAIYQDVADQLSARGISPTPENVNAEFTRLTIQNYLAYPGFQLTRVAEALRSYGAFEGETERPEQYGFFYRPYLLALFSFGYAVLALIRTPGARRLAVGVPGVALGLALIAAPERAPVALSLIGLAGMAVAGIVAVVRSPTNRAVGGLVVGLYWVGTGLLAILTTGIVGFFLNRLYTQVEPERTLLLAFGAAGVSLYLCKPRQRAEIVSARPLVSWIPRFSPAVRLLGPAAAVAMAVIVFVGGTRLVLANVTTSNDTKAFIPPSESDMSALANRLGLPDALQYVTADTFVATHATVVSGKLPPEPGFYAIPGEFTRFFWYLSDQDRTLYWYVFADQTRPASLDLTRITAESMGNLTEEQLGNRAGLLILAVDSAYFDATGDVTQQDVLTARAFVPWDGAGNRFQTEAPVVFPLGIPLYDHARFEAADKFGKTSEAGPLRVQAGDRLLRALSLQPAEAAPGGRKADITYHNVWVPRGAHLHAWIALHPRFFGKSTLGVERVDVAATTSSGSVQLAGYELDPMNADQRTYVPLDVDLGAFTGQNIDLSIAVSTGTSAGEAGEVLVAEPRIVVVN